jgi:ABC-type multidrug transport system fused ATPase/permease subunit
MFLSLKALWIVIKPRHRRQLFGYLLFSLFLSFSELFLLYSFRAFSIILLPSRSSSPIVPPFFPFFSQVNPVIYGCLLLMVAAIIVNVSRLTSSFLALKLTSNILSYITTLLYEGLLTLDFPSYLKVDSSQFVGSCTVQVSKVLEILNSLFLFFNSCFSAFIVLFALLLYSPLLTVFTSLPILIIYYLLYGKQSLVLSRFGRQAVRALDNKLLQLRDTFGLFADILLTNSSSSYLSRFSANERSLQNANIFVAFVPMIPKPVIESIVFFSISLFTLIAYLFFDSSYISLFSTIAILALGFQRLLPNIQQIYSSLSVFNSHSWALRQVINSLPGRSPLLSSRSLPTSFISLSPIASLTRLSFNDVSFKYKNSPRYTLEHVTFQFCSGDFIAILGPSGSGKTTLINNLLGFLTPTSGNILFDTLDINSSPDALSRYQSILSYVSSNPYLVDSTILDNILLNSSSSPASYDEEHLSEIISICQLSELCETLPQGLHYQVGQNGSNLSGGQVQRILIARALYRKPKILILDESTSSLDQSTQLNVLSALSHYCRDMIVVFVTHRSSSLDYCSHIYRLIDHNLVFSPS